MSKKTKQAPLDKTRLVRNQSVIRTMGFSNPKPVSPVVSVTRRNKEAANLFLADLAIVLLSGVDPAMAPQLAGVTASLKQGVIERWGDDYPHLVSCKRVIDTLGRKLLECEDKEQILLALNNVDALNTSNVYLAADDQEIIMEESK